MSLPVGFNVDSPRHAVSANRRTYVRQKGPSTWYVTSPPGTRKFPLYLKRHFNDTKTSIGKFDNAQINRDQFLVFVPPHPLIKHWISVLRNEYTPGPMFKNALAELGRLLIYEASRDWLATVVGDIQTPCGIASVEFIDPREPVKVVPILRAGLVLVEHLSTVLPSTQTYHLGLEVTKHL
eukprot:TRINITY_DN14867_c0_g2_i1.p1 TRINITY_DN14867_c0_g2~~TRINITY_DN14867_c0_g2_i1.p1  ORF type:complete len:180 (+),score=7.15 TRINITY_DN14867_c0_g2_i1:80-619(+)